MTILSKPLKSYRLRVQRRTLRARARYKSRELKVVQNRSDQIRPSDVLCFVTMRNELIRLPYFLEYYRKMGVSHFFVVDNDSSDGTKTYLERQSDVSLFRTLASYRRARYGLDWMNHLLRKYGTGHWCLTVDADELFCYPFSDTRPIDALTDWLDGGMVRSFGAMLLDMYPKGPVGAHKYKPGMDPLEIAPWFDPGNYVLSKNKRLENLWIQGGPRARIFFADQPHKAPALNKVPLVKWDNRYVYSSSTHSLLPRGLNHVYDEWGGEMASGVLLHTKFLSGFAQKAREELDRREHYSNSVEYLAYGGEDISKVDLWCPWSERFINWRQLEILGLMSKGNWA